jgi:predicted DNA-binding ribbon-helix-helix protein
MTSLNRRSNYLARFTPELYEDLKELASARSMKLNQLLNVIAADEVKKAKKIGLIGVAK